SCLIIVSLISYHVSYNIVKSEVNQKSTESVKKYANQFNTWFVEQGKAVDYMVEDIEINDDYNEGYLLNYFTSKLKRQKSPAIDYYMGFPQRSQKFIDGSGWNPPSEFDCTSRKWYRGALQNDGLVYTTPYLDASTNKMIFTIAMPVKQKGSIKGVVGADILLTELIELAQNSKTAESDYSFLLDHEHNFLVHPVKSFLPTPNKMINAADVLNGRYLPLINEMNSSSDRIVEIKDYDGVERFFILSTVKSTNWTFGVAIPKSKYLAALNKLLLGFLVALSISLVLAIIIIWFFINSLVNPIVKLREAVCRYSLKDFSSRSPVLTRDEVGELSQSFNNMADIIQEHSETLQEKVEERTRELYETNVRIMESIDYAKRIQASILPNLEERITLAQDNYFIIWKPRDIVGGDFYWCKQRDHDFYIAVVDCTGHGVPGALMTMTVNALLDRIGDNHDYSEPAVFLEKLDQLLRETLGQDNPEASTNDGLDIGLCLIKTLERKLIYSGARIPLIYTQDDEVRKIKGDRRSIGYKTVKSDYKFNNHEIDLCRTTTCYLSTDGLFDQNGVENEYGFGSKRFQALIDEIHEQSMNNQKDTILTTLNGYMGSEDQRDDIAIIGFKF
ncbi:MAG: cache domain-containing protein, partial [Syntrophomonas sp.]